MAGSTHYQDKNSTSIMNFMIFERYKNYKQDVEI